MRLLLIFIFSTSIFCNCLDDYKSSYKKKIDKYQLRLKNYNDNRSRSMFSKDIVVSILNSKSKAPKKPYIFEEDILQSAGFKTDFKTVAVMEIYNQLKSVHPFIKPELVQAEFKAGLSSGNFCKSIFGKKRMGQAKKYVLKRLKAKRDVAKAEDLKINDQQNIKEPDLAPIIALPYNSTKQE